MERLFSAVLGLGAIYLIVLFFVAIGSRQFMSNRTLIQNPPVVAAVLTVIILIVAGWREFFGRDAGLAFGILVVIVILGVAFASSKK
ncbi:hypothetical protein [Bradyrhizobium iriomotense]|uniref:hypothetical protein n=1 Tax=Bradyrhizobium iriomotense TaxID=441950 RepID=UPI001B8A6080|nr:hypothetical protein [Bradyrhizobium iriomotense]MBR0780035.1 hypothetical protein [Bradyrhizobium iriomotense]